MQASHPLWSQHSNLNTWIWPKRPSTPCSKINFFLLTKASGDPAFVVGRISIFSSSPSEPLPLCFKLQFSLVTDQFCHFRVTVNFSNSSSAENKLLFPLAVPGLYLTEMTLTGKEPWPCLWPGVLWEQLCSETCATWTVQSQQTMNCKDPKFQRGIYCMGAYPILFVNHSWE